MNAMSLFTAENTRNVSHCYVPCRKATVAVSLAAFLAIFTLDNRRQPFRALESPLSLASSVYHHTVCTVGRSAEVLSKQALRPRDTALGPEFLPTRTGMGYINTGGVDGQIEAYSRWATQPWVGTVCGSILLLRTQRCIFGKQFKSEGNCFNVIAMPGDKKHLRS